MANSGAIGNCGNERAGITTENTEDTENEKTYSVSAFSVVKNLAIGCDVVLIDLW